LFVCQFNLPVAGYSIGKKFGMIPHVKALDSYAYLRYDRFIKLKLIYR
jgi:hypothetical protein